MYILWTVNDINIGTLGARDFSCVVHSSGVGHASIASSLLSASFGRRNEVKYFRLPRARKKKNFGTQGKTLKANDEIYCRNLSIEE